MRGSGFGTHDGGDRALDGRWPDPRRVDLDLRLVYDEAHPARVLDASVSNRIGPPELPEDISASIRIGPPVLPEDTCEIDHARERASARVSARKR